MPSTARSSGPEPRTAPDMRVGLRFLGGVSTPYALLVTRNGRARKTREANCYTEEPVQQAAIVNRMPPAESTADRAPFHIVFVCTGNRARSPLAEAFLRAKIGNRAVRIESYGTLELGPEPAMPEAIAAASALRIDIRGHRARSFCGRSGCVEGAGVHASRASDAPRGHRSRGRQWDACVSRGRGACPSASTRRTPIVAVVGRSIREVAEGLRGGRGDDRLSNLDAG